MGVSVIDPVAMKEIQFIPTGRGAHGLQVSRDTKSLYVSNRLEGTFSVIDFATRTVTAKWHIQGGGSPDMLQLSPDGTQLWASGRYHKSVYVMDTTTGATIARIAVGSEDHGLTYFPNVGTHSLGHNGVYR
jgi:YVTN family beta-propeller protein